MKNLNEEQEKAVSHGDGCCVVTSNPGSGKTLVLTERVIHLIEKGVLPENILCLTFTNKATNEMRERISVRIKGAEKVWISTFHKLCVSVLRKFGSKIDLNSNFSILIEKDQIDLMKKISRIQGQDFKDNEIRSIVHLANTFREEGMSLSEFLDKLHDEEGYKADIYEDIILEYFKTMKECHVVDFSGLLYRCYELLKTDEKLSLKLANKFKYILIDEGQDTNAVQYEIIKMIAKHHNNLFVVGDQNQSLYSWRAARPENMNKLFSDFENTREIRLPKNYRSTTNILKIAEKLIRNNPNAEKTAFESIKGDGEDVKVYTFYSPDIEADYICQQINQTMEYENISFKDIAILYRINVLSKILEQKLRQYGIPYKIVSGYSFYDRKEIRDALAYLTLCSNPHDSIAFHRAISYPKRGLGNVSIGKIEKLAKEKNKTIFDIYKYHLGELELNDKSKKTFKDFCELYMSVSDSPLKAIQYLLNESGYLKELGAKGDEDSFNRVENLAEFVTSVQQYCEEFSSPSVSDFLNQVALQNIEKEDDEEEDCVELSTIHAAKGREFDTVFIVGVEEGLLPHRLSMNEGPDSIYEERRTLFVAITRSQQRLFMTHCKNRKRFVFGNKKASFIPCSPSRFLKEII